MSTVPSFDESFPATLAPTVTFSVSRRARHASLSTVALVGLLAVAGFARADDADDKAREEMQRSLNAQVMASPFNPGDINKAEAYAKEAQKNGVVPVVQVPGYWAPGWTCASMTSYRYYNYGDYRNCVYYHHYYGRYWR